MSTETGFLECFGGPLDGQRCSQDIQEVGRAPRKVGAAPPVCLGGVYEYAKPIRTVVGEVVAGPTGWYWLPDGVV